MNERRMLHKPGGKWVIVETEDAKEAALADGWQLHKVIDLPEPDPVPDPPAPKRKRGN